MSTLQENFVKIKILNNYKLDFATTKKKCKHIE